MTVPDNEATGLAEGEALGLMLLPGGITEIGISGFGLSPERSRLGPPAR